MNNIARENEILLEHEKYFPDNFIAELDSWFSADIACCDNCYDQFLEFWPLAHEAENAEFQKSCIDLDSFYSGSLLHQLYTKEEYDVLKHTMHCPRCGASLWANMWVYDLPFAHEVDTYDFELEIENISELSKQTPFLLLKNNFALKIHDLLHSIADETPIIKTGQPLYRARPANQIEKLDYKEFTVAPKKFIQEGRYNHAGGQVFYLASDIETCFNEVNKKICFVVECSIETDLKILDLIEPDKIHEKYCEQLNALVFSALMSKPLSSEGWDKPVYIFSRFIADCAKSAGFDAIKYPSTKAIKNNFNLAVLNENIFNNHVKFKNVYFFDGSKPTQLMIQS